MRHIFIIFACFIGLTNSLLAQDKDPIHIAVCGPFTGSGSDYGKMIARGVNLKVEEINKAGGINGRMIAIDTLDDAGDPNVASTVARKVAGNPKYSCVVGHFNSSCSLAAKPIYKRTGIVALSPGSTNVKVCEGSDWFFRNLYRDDYQGNAIAEYVAKGLGLKKVAVIYDADDYGTGLKNDFVQSASALGLEVLTPEAYNREGNKDFGGIITSLKSKNPDIVFVSGLYSEAAQIAKTMKRKGLKSKLIAGDGVFQPAFIELAGKAANGAYIFTPYLNDPSASKKIADFSNSFRAANGGDEPDAWAALSYDALGTLVQVIKEVGTDRKAIRDALAQINTKDKAYDGVTGLTYFDVHGDCVKPAIVAMVSQEKFTKAPVQLNTSDSDKKKEAVLSTTEGSKAATEDASAEKKEGSQVLILVIAAAAVIALFLIMKKPSSQ